MSLQVDDSLTYAGLYNQIQKGRKALTFVHRERGEPKGKNEYKSINQKAETVHSCWVHLTWPYLSKYIPKIGNSKATKRIKKSSFMKGLLHPQIPSHWRVNALRSSIGLGYKQCIWLLTSSPFDTFSLEVCLNAFPSFRAHSKGIPKGKMDGSKAHPILEKMNP